MRRLTLGALLLSLLAGCTTTTPGVRTGVARTKIVLDGKPLKIDAYYSLNVDCSSLGLANVNVLEEPRLGTLDIRVGQDFPNFHPGNMRSDCNLRKMAMKQVFYLPSPGAKGLDQFRVETVFPNGNAQVVTYRVEVR